MNDDRSYAEDPRVAAVLAAAAAPAEAPLPGEAAALAAYREIHRPVRRTRRMPARENIKLVAAALFGGVVMASGVATAATGGSFLPTHHDHPATSHSPAAHQQDGTDDDATTPQTDSDQPTQDGSQPDNHGAQVSSTAKTTDPGPGHGQTVCALASDQKCMNGGQSDATTHGKPADPNANGVTHSSGHDTTGLTHRHSSTTDDTATHGQSADADTSGSTHSGGHADSGLAHRSAH